jgi:N-acetyl-gamma-glutamyl-phosphate reductase
MIKTAIIGASGYTGLELIRILHNHPETEISYVNWSRDRSEQISNIFPGLKNICDINCTKPDLNKTGKDCDIVFLAVPHKTAMNYVKVLINYDIKIIDLSADFRLNDKKIYENTYKTEHICPELLNTKVYGLPELYRNKIKSAQLVANPGCYPTCSILGAYPLLKEKLISSDIIIDAKSGVSGAGKKLSERAHFSETNENFLAYSFSHRHQPEIAQEYSLAADTEINPVFIPHLLPMNRGMLCAQYFTPLKKLSYEDLYQLYTNYYKNEYFVRVLEKNIFPETKFSKYSNFCDIGLSIDKTGKIIVVSCIDNVCKGASGQAIQNMNIMSGLNEKTGLEFAGIYP